MANVKFTDLNPNDRAPNLAGTDILAVTTDPSSSSPVSKATTITNLMGQAPVQSVAGHTGTVLLSNTDISGLGTAATANTGTADGNVLAIGSGGLDVGGNAISNFDASINTKTSDYTVVASDNGKVVVLDSSTAVTVTVPNGLGAGFNCSFVQKGTGQVTFAESQCDIDNRQGHTKINGQYGVASIVAYANNFFVLAGDTTA